MTAPFGALEYLYIRTAGFERDLAYYRDVLGARLLWNLEGFDAHVAALRLGTGPLLLLADHRPAPSCMPLFSVEDLKAAAKGNPEARVEARREALRDPERSLLRVQRPEREPPRHLPERSPSAVRVTLSPGSP